MPINVIFHIDEMAKWPLLLGNVQNLINALGDKNYRIEVLANSEAVKLYSESETEFLFVRISELAAAGVQFVACNNALNALGIPKDQLPRYIQIVPAGVLELVERQQQGYGYIKP